MCTPRQQVTVVSGTGTAYYVNYITFTYSAAPSTSPRVIQRLKSVSWIVQLACLLYITFLLAESTKTTNTHPLRDSRDEPRA